MFNLPVDEINFDAVRDFCLREQEEGLDLDYKRDWPNDLSRVICGMANVQGGMILVGVDEQPNTRRPAWPAPGVSGTEDALHQRAIQIAYDAIYPPVIPEVVVCPLDNDPTRAVVVVRVGSSRLLHATDGRRRVYIRVADQGRGYELADLSQLEWLYKEREKSVDLREVLLSRALQRANRTAGMPQSSSDGELTNQPKLTVYATPVFPNQIENTNPSDLMQLARTLPQSETYWPGIGSETLPTFPRWRTATQSVFSSRETARGAQYFELGSNGLVLLHEKLPIYEEQNRTAKYINAPNILIKCSAFIDYTARFFREFSWLGPILVHVSLKDIADCHLDHRFLGSGRSAPENSFTLDDQAHLFDDEVRAQDMARERDRMLTDIACSILWTFGFPDNRDAIRDNYLARMMGNQNTG